MRNTGLIALLFMVSVLSACGGQAQPQPLGVVEIVSPQANQEFLPSSAILVKGSVVDGANVEVTIGEGTPVTASLAAASDGRRAWEAELTAPTLGSYTITATADALDGLSHTASVAVKIVGPRASGRWDGEFAVYDGTAEREQVTGGSMVVLYNSNWFRMYFGAIEVNGTTDNWDLIDKADFRIRGTYHAAGETNRRGDVMSEPWVDFDAVMADGKIIEGTATRGN